MDRTWLEKELRAGRSIESIAREVDRNPSTVAYWVNKHGLISAHAERHAARGGIARETLVALVEEGLSVRQIAARCGASATTVRHWLKAHALRTRPARYSPRDGPRRDALIRECGRHGWTAFKRSSSGAYRCKLCRQEAVSERRRRVKQILVDEAGGRCRLCGYDRYVGALQFHHVDPASKRFAVASRGLARSIDTVRAEVAKCVLLCANCHAEVEAGLATIAPTGPADNVAEGAGPYTGRG